MRTVIDEYTFDKKAAPQRLEDLVTEGYLRAVPIDPMTSSNETWEPVFEDGITAVDQTQPGIWDVRSGSTDTSLEGNPYREW
jgi:general secretion pathway protein G